MSKIDTSEAFEAPTEQKAARAMKLYYRHRKNGAVVFRLEVANRQRRIELNQIASISKTGEVIPHKRRQPTDAEMEEIAAWWADWNARKDTEQLSDSELFLAELNQFTDWFQRRAEPEEVDVASDPLLMALLDLRQVVVRRLSDMPSDDAASDDPIEPDTDPES
ncbi:MAG: hypothetical protein AAGH68_10015 [Pseudomonadota bacterium]